MTQICIAKDCVREVNTLNFCSKHYAQYRNGIIDVDGNQLRELKKGKGITRQCRYDGCDRITSAKGFCTKHYGRLQKGIIDINGISLRPLAVTPRTPASYKSIIEVHNGIADNGVRAGLREIASMYTEYNSGHFNKTARTYEELIEVHNNSDVHKIRKKAKTQAAQMSEFNDADFNRLTGLGTYEELLEQYKNAKDARSRAKIRNKAKYRPGYKFKNFDNIDEKKALQKYIDQVERHNTTENSLLRARIKQRLKGLRSGKFFKDEHFKRIRPKYNYKCKGIRNV